MKKMPIALLASGVIGVMAYALFHCQRLPSNLHFSTASPGYYSQWVSEHQNEQGVIPYAAYERWAVDDQQHIRASERGNSPIAAVEQLAPSTPQGGRTRALMVDRRNANTWWAGNVSGGLWRSNDAGSSWRAIDDGAATLAISCITQNPFRPDEIYYGTGEGRGSSVPPGRGVFRSTDGGLTFQLLPASNITGMRYCNQIAHSLAKDSLVYVGTSDGLYISRDAGTSWTRVLIGAISDIVCHPSGQVLVGRQGLGLYLSNNGYNFTRITQSDFPGTRNLGHVLVENCRDFPSVAYAFFTTSQYQGADANAGLFRSADFGQTWTKMGDSTTINARVGSTQAQYNQMLGVHASNPDWIIIGGVNARKSLDGGKTFVIAATGHSDQHTAIPLTNSDDMLVGNDGGIFRVGMRTNTLVERNTGYLTHQYYAGNFAPQGTLTIGGTQDNGTWRHNATVASKAFGADGGFAHLHQQDPEVGYFSIQNGPVFRLLGLTAARPNTTTVSPTEAITEGVDFINEFQMNYADGNQLYYRTNKGIWRTTDAGNTWMRLNIQNVANIKAIGVSPEPNPRVYIGGSNVFYRIDGAATTTAADSMVNLSATVPAVSRPLVWGNISFHPLNPNTIFVGMTTMTLSPRAFRVDNAHTNNPVWKNITGNLSSELPIYYIQPHPDNPEQVLFAATAYGLYYTLNGGETWQKETRLPNVAVFDLRLRTTDKTLFAFTHGRGVWQLPLTTLAVGTSEAERATELFRVFPNPAVDILRVQQIGNNSTLRTAQIFDTQGRLLLNHLIQDPVSEIPVHTLPAGQYIMRVYDWKGRYSSKLFIKS